MNTNEPSLLKTLKISYGLLNVSEKRKFVLVSISQIILSILDLLGVMIFGVIAALTVNGIANKGPGNRVSKFLDILGLKDLNLQKQALILGLIGAILLISKTFISFMITKRTSLFLSRRSALISSDIFRKVLMKDLLYIRKRSTQQMIFSVISSVQGLVTGFLVTSAAMFADVALTITLLLGISILDWKMSIFTLVFYSSLVIILHLRIKKRITDLNRSSAKLNVTSSSLFVESIIGYRDLVVRSARNKAADLFLKQRLQLASFSAEFAISGSISKYLMEIALVIGSILICSYQFVTQDASRAIATLSIFLAASARITPAILRIQQGVLVMKSTSASAEELLKLIDEVNINDAYSVKANESNIDFIPEVYMKDIEFAYDSGSDFALRNFSLYIPKGSFCALVGPSGGGKSTIVDLMLGVIKVNKGSVKISNIDVSEVFEMRPGAIGYVPQETIILEGSVAENVSFFLEIEENKVLESLEKARLKSFVLNLPNGIYSEIGERGSKLSGGQKQRLGIARSLYTDPGLLILDEATSSLDGQTEIEISNTFKNLKGKKTLVVIAHRLSTVRDADMVVYIDGGKIIAQGNFEEVRSAVPEFDKQAKLLSL